MSNREIYVPPKPRQQRKIDTDIQQIQPIQLITKQQTNLVNIPTPKLHKLLQTTKQKHIDREDYGDDFSDVVIDENSEKDNKTIDKEIKNPQTRIDFRLASDLEKELNSLKQNHASKQIIDKITTELKARNWPIQHN